jgi:MazG family protein
MPRPFAPVVVPALAEQRGEAFIRVVELMRRLLAADGCPWDREQTPESLRRYVLEEACEVIDAIDAGDRPSLQEELGDLLLQVVFLGEMMRNEGEFGPDDIARGLVDKLVRRHPHVFGDVRVSDASEVVTNWEQIKKTEKDDQSLVAGVTAGLPALIAAQKLFRKGASIGLEPATDLDGAMRQLSGAEEPEIEAALGAALASVVAVGRAHDIDAESALAGWARRYKERFRRMEQLAIEAHVDLAAADPAAVRDLWNQAET